MFSLGIVAHQLFTGEVPYKVAYTGGKSYGPVDYEKTRANMERSRGTDVALCVFELRTVRDTMRKHRPHGQLSEKA